MATSKVVKSAAKKPPAAGKGRAKGVPNKNTKALKDMILGALDAAGGVQYLQSCAENPRTASAFLTLVGKVLPMQVTGEGGGPLDAKLTIEYVRPKNTAS